MAEVLLFLVPRTTIPLRLHVLRRAGLFPVHNQDPAVVLRSARRVHSQERVCVRSRVVRLRNRGRLRSR
jgi:hypothetical protein